MHLSDFWTEIVRDGTASLFTELGASCDAISTTDAYAYIKSLEVQGCVVDTNGYGETAAADESDPSCTDTKGADICATVVQGGLLTCDDDFCDGEHCGHSHQCDRTCGLCPVHRRQLQIAMPECSMQLFQDQDAELNTACCDQPGACSSGVPDTCDVKCARVFFVVGRCSRVLAAPLLNFLSVVK